MSLLAARTGPPHFFIKPSWRAPFAISRVLHRAAWLVIDKRNERMRDAKVPGINHGSAGTA
jgi:hypothetical protein